MYNLISIQEKINNRFPQEDIQVVSFTKVKEKFVVRCSKCKTEYEFANADNVINGKKKNICTHCNPDLRKDTLAVKNKVEYLIKKLTKVKVLTEFVNITTDLEILCLNCGEVFKRKPQVFLKSQKCPYCDSKSKTKPFSVFEKELLELYGEEYVCLDKYVNANTKIKIKHKCGFVWEITPHNLLCGKGCPKCYRFSSKGERAIEKFLQEKRIDYQKEKTFEDLPYLRFDFYLPLFNVAIEFQGLQHYEPIPYFGGEQQFIKQQSNDCKKKQYCDENNIDFLEIKYSQLNDINQILSTKLNDYLEREYTQVSGKEGQPTG